MPESSSDISNKTKDNLAAIDEVSDSANNSFPGRILRAAREELNFTVEQVAEELHLRPSVVLSMEAEKYEDFSSVVFLKGYFRSYCRLVNLHESRMIDLLEAQLKGLQKEIDDAAYLIKKKQQTKKQKKALLSLLLVVIIIGVVSALFSLLVPMESNTDVIEQTIDNTKEKKQQLIENNTAKPSVVVNETANLQKAVTHNQTAVIDSSNKISTELVTIISDLNPNAVGKQRATRSEENALSEADLKEPKNSSIKEQPTVPTFITALTPEKSSVQSEQAKPDLPAKKVENKTDIQNVDVSIFEASFSGDCWFKLVDANGKTVFAALKRRGETVTYSGLAPFNIVLGDASKVEISFNHAAINLKSHTAKNGRAQLTLNKGLG